MDSYFIFSFLFIVFNGFVWLLKLTDWLVFGFSWPDFKESKYILNADVNLKTDVVTGVNDEKNSLDFSRYIGACCLAIAAGFDR
ncbi:hypothetical protein [Thalassomonas sp. RHCl1]|uniref:hypothetical protein n=1 Tax=Thalassomonas sp. RHCl1 TaxID=2995320 RepID=UPI00248D359C|nr:hypothetical protein [Thalassomonas sp. RHCl1]